MSSRNSKSNKSYGLRMLWLPGRRKSHHTTSRRSVFGYGSSKQKKNEMWSLGGTKAQATLLHAELNTTLLDVSAASGHPSTANSPVAAGFRSVTDAAGRQQTATVVFYSKDTEAVQTLLAPSSQISATVTTTAASVTTTTTSIDVVATTETATTTTTTPSSTESNTPTMSVKTSKDNYQTTNNSTETLNGLKINRFVSLSREVPEEFDVNDLPNVPKDNLFLRENLVFNTTADTLMKTVSTASTATPSSPQSDNTEPNKSDENVLAKKKLNTRNHNNNQQSDVNTIERISDSNYQSLKPLNTDFGWNEEFYLEQNGKDVVLLQKNKHKKKKKIATSKELDQLDGVPNKQNTNEVLPEEDDEKVVKCLYYTLMCCDCSIS